MSTGEGTSMSAKLEEGLRAVRDVESKDANDEEKIRNFQVADVAVLA